MPKIFDPKITEESWECFAAEFNDDGYVAFYLTNKTINPGDVQAISAIPALRELVNAARKVVEEYIESPGLEMCDSSELDGLVRSIEILDKKHGKEVE